MKYYPVIRIFIVMFFTAAAILFVVSEGNVSILEEVIHQVIETDHLNSSSNALSSY